MEKRLESISEKFVHAAVRNRERTAFIYVEERTWKTLKYGDFLNKVSSIVQLFQSIGVTEKTKIAIYAHNSPRWAGVYLAVTMLRGIAVPIDAELGSRETANILRHCGPLVIVSDDSTKELADEAIRLAGIKTRNLNIDSPEFLAAWNALSIQTVKDISAVKPDDLASIIYTSGTTGIPKGVMLTHGNFCSEADSLIYTGIVFEDDNVLAILPLHHAYAFMCTMIVPLFIGAAITYPAAIRGAELMATIKNKGVTVVAAVPALLDMILNGIDGKIREKNFLSRAAASTLLMVSGYLRGYFDINLGRKAFGSISNLFGERFRFFICGGAKLSPLTMKRLEAFGLTIIEGYGLTESSPVVTFNPIDHRKPNSAGVPLKDIMIKIDGPDGTDGEILVKGPMVMAGYFNMQRETAEVLKDGWLYTGDSGYMDSDGYLFITGRKKEVIVLPNGKNIYPQDVEELYSDIPLIKEICVYDADGTLSAIIVPDMDVARENQVGSLMEALKREINGAGLKIPPYMRLMGFSLSMDPLPRTPLGKLRRFRVIEIHRKREEAKKVKKAAPPETYEDGLTNRVIAAIRKVIQRDGHIDLSDNLELDIGLDSLKKVELVVEIERIIGTGLNDSFILDIHTVNDLIERVRQYTITPPDINRPPTKRILIEEDEADRLREILSRNPDYSELRSIGLGSGRFERLIASVVLWIMRWVFRIFYLARIRGIENLINQPFIICPNHSSYLDPFLLASMIPGSLFRQVYFQGAQRLFKGRIVGRLARIAHCIPIDTSQHLSKALSISSYLLKNQKSLCIFPEGTRTYDGGIQEFKKGVGILSSYCKVPLIPVYINGTYKALSRGRSLLRPAILSITIGRPIYPKDVNRSDVKDNFQRLSDEARNRVVEMSVK